MSLKKSSLIVVISCTIIILLILTIVLFPLIVDNIMTGFASFATFSVSLIVSPNPNAIANTTNITEPKKNISIAFFSLKRQASSGGGAILYSEIDEILINVTAPGAYEDYLILHNPENAKKEITINHTTNFVHDLVKTITLEPNESKKIIIPINTNSLEPGEYKDFIIIGSEGKTQTITVTLRLLEQKKEESKVELPALEQPLQVAEPVLKQNRKTLALPDIVILIICVIVIAGIILFRHVKKGGKAIKNQTNGSGDTTNVVGTVNWTDDLMSQENEQQENKRK